MLSVEDYMKSEQSKKDSLKKNKEEEIKSKRFKIFPCTKKEFWRKEPLDLRKCFKTLIPFHVFIIIFFDMWAYHFEIMSIIADVGFLYLDY